MMEVLYSPKIKPEHLARKAIVYLRQSSDKQVRQNKESQHLQYAVAERMRALGWNQVEVINSDLGLSAGIASAEREGFERVLSSVALGEVGIVGSREVSRLSRTDKDWCRLLEVCQIFGTLIADEQQVYDLNYLDDQLVLGINRPDTQNTSYSTFWRTTIPGSVAQFGTGARLSPRQAVPAADIPDVLTGKTPAKGTTEAGAIQRRCDFCIGAPRSQFVNPGNRFFWRLQRTFSARSPLHA